MFKMILSAIVALGFTVVAHAQEGAAPAAPAKMDAAPAPGMEAPAPAAEAKAKKHKHKKSKKEEAPKAE